jgi:hypothetical protein
VQLNAEAATFVAKQICETTTPALSERGADYHGGHGPFVALVSGLHVDKCPNGRGLCFRRAPAETKGRLARYAAKNANNVLVLIQSLGGFFETDSL